MSEAAFDASTIERLVRDFYAKVRQDDMLGPVFNPRVADWEHHIERIVAFWSSIAFGKALYDGHPMRKHLPLPVGGAHFDRWLALFAETAEETCPPAAAKFLIDRARRIAESFELGVAATRGVMLGKGERLPAP
jgi:hemoglobin